MGLRLHYSPGKAFHPSLRISRVHPDRHRPVPPLWRLHCPLPLLRLLCHPLRLPPPPRRQARKTRVNNLPPHRVRRFSRSFPPTCCCTKSFQIRTTRSIFSSCPFMHWNQGEVS